MAFGARPWRYTLSRHRYTSSSGDDVEESEGNKKTNVRGRASIRGCRVRVWGKQHQHQRQYQRRRRRRYWNRTHGVVRKSKRTNRYKM